MGNLPCHIAVSGKSLVRLTFFVGDLQYQIVLEKKEQQDFRHVVENLETAGASAYNGDEGTLMMMCDQGKTKIQFKLGGNYGSGLFDSQELMEIVKKFPAHQGV